MPRKEYLYAKADELFKNTATDFIKETGIANTMSQFFEKYLILFMMAYDREAFIRLLQENSNKLNIGMDDRIKALVKLTEVFNFWVDKKCAFKTEDDLYVTLDELIEKGWAIENNKLIVNRIKKVVVNYDNNEE